MLEIGAFLAKLEYPPRTIGMALPVAIDAVLSVQAGVLRDVFYVQSRRGSCGGTVILATPLFVSEGATS